MLPSRVRFFVCVCVRALLLCACGERCDGKRESYYKWTTTTASSEMDGATIFNGDDFFVFSVWVCFCLRFFVSDIFGRCEFVSNELKQNEVKFNCKWTRNIENMHRRVVVVVVVAVAIKGTPSKVCAHTIFELWFSGTQGACRRTNGRTVIAREHEHVARPIHGHRNVFISFFASSRIEFVRISFRFRFFLRGNVNKTRNERICGEKKSKQIYLNCLLLLLFSGFAVLATAVVVASRASLCRFMILLKGKRHHWIFFGRFALDKFDRRESKDSQVLAERQFLSVFMAVAFDLLAESRLSDVNKS